MVKNHNKIRRIGIFALICLIALGVIITISVAIALKSNKIVINYTDLGVPYLDIYSDEQINSRLAEDITVFDGKLYVGGGDYDQNTGPVYVMSYDLNKGKWEQSQEPLNDEQIKRFCVINGKLATLGTDPKDDWDMGNYYVLCDGAWETLRVLPSGIHCFDAIEWQNEIIFGLGVNSGDFPAVRFDGENYTAIDFYKNGEPLDTSHHSTVRIYNFFAYKGELFAFLTLDKTDENANTIYFMDLYVYDGESFVFSHGSLPAYDMPSVVASGDAAYFIINDALLKTENLMEFSVITLGEDVKVSDMIECDGKIYVLGWREIRNGYFEIIAFENDGNRFVKKFGLFAHAPAGSFCKDGDSFYISLGQREHPANTRDMGRVMEVKVK